MNNCVVLSVIIPFYNGCNYIEELIESVLSIPMDYMEVIIVNDGSKASETERLHTIIQVDPRIIYLEQENKGIVGARNTGLENAKGEYLLFCDQDDKVNPNIIKKTVDRMIRERADVAFYSTQHIDDRARKWECDTVYEEGIFREEKVADIFIRKLIIRYSSGTEYISYVGHLWGCIINHNLVTKYKIRFKKFMSIEDDLLYVLDVLNKAKSVVTLCDVGYYWRSNSISVTKSNKYIKNLNYKMNEYYKYRTDILVSHQICSEKEMKDYLLGMKQESALNLLYNETIPGFIYLARQYKSIKEILSEPIMLEALQSEEKCPYAVRNHKVMCLLRKRCYFLSVLYVYLVQMKRKSVYFVRRNFLKGETK